MKVKLKMSMVKGEINRCKKRFLKSTAPAAYKEICEKLDVVPIFINRSRGRNPLYAQAWCVSQSLRWYLGHEPIKIGRRYYFMIIEINRYYEHNYFTLKTLIGHEMGHLMQIIVDKEVDGQYNLANPKKDHGPKWQKLSSWFGGNIVAEW